MWKIQSKIKDSNLRNIDDYRKMKTDEEEEEKEFSSPCSMKSKRHRTNSINFMPLSSSFVRKTQLPKSVFANISAAIGGDDGSSNQYRLEAKKRGMSDVDDTNIR